MLITSTIGLIVYAGIMLVALCWPTRQHDPQRGQAIGCLMLVLVCLAALGGVLALAAWQNWQGMIAVVFWIVVFPGILLAGNAIYFLINKFIVKR